MAIGFNNGQRSAPSAVSSLSCLRVQLHLDTDLGGYTDDACALAMILGWPDAELLGVTTNIDIDGAAGRVRGLHPAARRPR